MTSSSQQNNHPADKVLSTSFAASFLIAHVKLIVYNLDKLSKKFVEFYRLTSTLVEFRNAFNLTQ